MELLGQTFVVDLLEAGFEQPFFEQEVADNLYGLCVGDLELLSRQLVNYFAKLSNIVRNNCNFLENLYD